MILQINMLYVCVRVYVYVYVYMCLCMYASMYV